MEKQSNNCSTSLEQAYSFFRAWEKHLSYATYPVKVQRKIREAWQLFGPERSRLIEIKILLYALLTANFLRPNSIVSEAEHLRSRGEGFFLVSREVEKLPALHSS